MTLRPRSLILTALALLVLVAGPGPTAAAAGPGPVDSNGDAALARELAAAAVDAHAAARRALLPVSMLNLQIRNALSTFAEYAKDYAAAAAAPGVTPEELRRAMRAVSMWGTTVDYHLAEAGNGAAHRIVRERWEIARTLWKRAESALGTRSAGPDPAFAEYRETWERLRPAFDGDERVARERAELEWRGYMNGRQRP